MLNNIPTAPSGSSQSGYHGREMDEMARKTREDNQRKLVLQKRQMEIKEMDLRTQEEKYALLRREITRLESQFKPVSTFKPVIGASSSQKRNEQKIRGNENKIRILEQQLMRLKKENEELSQKITQEKQSAEKAKNDSLAAKREVDEHQLLVQQKIQESTLAANRINALKEEIKLIQGRIQVLEK